MPCTPMLPDTAAIRQGVKVSNGPNGHFVALTGLRGIAAWWVVMFHFNEYMPDAVPPWVRRLFGNGYLAVDLFFILSGFILAYNYLSGFQRLDHRKYIRFLGVRLARIYPLHIVVLGIFLINPLAIFVAASAGISTVRYSPFYLFLSMLLVQNWGFTDYLAWNVPAWSISTEWFAYLCFPLVGLFVNSIPPGSGLVIAGTLLPLAALAIGIDAEGSTLGGDITQGGLVRCVAEFTAGIFLYRIWCDFGHFSHVSVAAAVLSLACGALYCWSNVSDYWLIPLAWAALILSLAAGLKPLDTVLSSPVMQTIGAWSYSTYLVHYLLRDWVKFLLIHDGVPTFVPLICYVCATAAASALLYRLIEVPGRLAFRHQLDRLIPGSSQQRATTQRRSASGTSGPSD